MDGKKISFGFSRVTKKPALQLSKTPKHDDNPNIELIKCLEGQQIKLVKEQKEATFLVIPLKDGGKTSAALASLAKRRAVLLGEDNEAPNKKSNEVRVSNGEGDEEKQTLDKRAETEILAELQAQNGKISEEDLVLPVVKPDDLPLNGAKESTLDDYESVPVGQYGWAMLRGMGAEEPPKSEQNLPIENGPMQRPPGLGLGADKALKLNPLLETPEANEKLEIKKQAFVRILAGKHKDCYGQIEGFDHERGTIIVKLAIGNLKQKFQEFLCQPVSKKEYAQYSKCINKAKYEEYKRLENEHGQVILKKGHQSNIVDVEATHEVKKHQHSKQTIYEISDLNKTNNTKNRSKADEQTEKSSRSSRYRSRSRSRSLSQPKKYVSRKRHHDSDSFNEDYKKSRETRTDSDSSYERRKPKSYRSHSKKPKKYKRHNNSSNDSSSSTASHDTDIRHKRDKKKKSKKKSKKSKKDRKR